MVAGQLILMGSRSVALNGAQTNFLKDKWFRGRALVDLLSVEDQLVAPSISRTQAALTDFTNPIR